MTESEKILMIPFSHGEDEIRCGSGHLPSMDKLNFSLLEASQTKSTKKKQWYCLFQFSTDDIRCYTGIYLGIADFGSLQDSLSA